MEISENKYKALKHFIKSNRGVNTLLKLIKAYKKKKLIITIYIGQKEINLTDGLPDTAMYWWDIKKHNGMKITKIYKKVTQKEYNKE